MTKTIALKAGLTLSYRGHAQDVRRGAQPRPLIVALHGGTYTSRYFDVAGYSLIETARSLGVPLVAIDRPGYGAADGIGEAETTQAGNAATLDAAVATLLESLEHEVAGVVLVGHSIGGAIALRLAARRPAWPLVGVAISGVGLRLAPGNAEGLERMPPGARIDVPPFMKDGQMFGLPGTFAPEAPDASRCADAKAPRRELVEIASGWPRAAKAVLAEVAVPVHYRQGRHDRLWTVDEAEVAEFAVACSKAPFVDARVVENSGHCIDFHYMGASFQLDQLAFALSCGVRHALSA